MTKPDRIPLLDLEAQNGPLYEEVRGAFERVARSGQFILGHEVEAFEREIAAYIGAPHAVGMSSGTDAILAALMALEIGSGDEVVTTPLSFFATVGCILRLGARPVFVDIEPGSFNLDPSQIDRAITSRTRAIMPVHLFGQPCKLAPIRAVADEHRLAVIEDAAQALGAKSDTGPIGVVGEAVCFSFFPSKNLGAFGDAGLVTTASADVDERLRRLRVQGARPKYFHALVGGNFRLDALQAAILRVKLPHLDRWTAQRRQNAERYDALFAEAGLPRDVLAPPPRVEAGHVYNQYVIRTSRRDALKAHLDARGIGCEIYYPLALHLQECTQFLGYEPGSMPEAERATREALALPIFPELGEDRLARVAGEVVSFLRG